MLTYGASAAGLAVRRFFDRALAYVAGLHVVHQVLHRVTVRQAAVHDHLVHDLFLALVGRFSALLTVALIVLLTSFSSGVNSSPGFSGEDPRQHVAIGHRLLGGHYEQLLVAGRRVNSRKPLSGRAKGLPDLAKGGSSSLSGSRNSLLPLAPIW